MSQNCPTRQIVARIGDKWTFLILVALANEGGALRYGQLRHLVEGISPKALANALRALERDGILDRQVLPTAPVSVRYSLTRLGESLVKTLSYLQEWTYSNMDGIVQSREAYDSSGHSAGGQD